MFCIRMNTVTKWKRLKFVDSAMHHTPPLSDYTLVMLRCRDVLRMASFALLLAISGIFQPSERILITLVQVSVTVPGSRLLRCPCADPHCRLAARRHWQIRGKQGTSKHHVPNRSHSLHCTVITCVIDLGAYAIAPCLPRTRPLVVVYSIMPPIRCSYASVFSFN